MKAARSKARVPFDPVLRGSVTLAIIFASGCSAPADAPELRDREKQALPGLAVNDADLVPREPIAKLESPLAAFAEPPAPDQDTLPLEIVVDDLPSEQITAAALTHERIVPSIVPQPVGTVYSRSIDEMALVTIANTTSLHPPEQMKAVTLPALASAFDLRIAQAEAAPPHFSVAAAPEPSIATLSHVRDIETLTKATPPPPKTTFATRDPRVEMEQIAPVSREIHMAQLGGTDGVLMAVRQGRDVLGQVEFQVSGSGIGVHIGQVLDLFRDRMDSTQFAALRNSQAAQTFVSLEMVRDAGVPLEYDPVYDELVLGG